MTANILGRYVGVATIFCCLAVPAAGPRALRAAEAPQPAVHPADAILGDWRPTDMDVTVRIFTLKGKYVGGVVKAANPQMVNTELLREIAFDAATGTWRGEIFAAKRGAFVPMTITMTRNGFEMVAGSGIMSKTIEWVRAPTPAPANGRAAVPAAPGGAPR